MRPEVGRKRLYPISPDARSAIPARRRSVSVVPASRVSVFEMSRASASPVHPSLSKDTGCGSEIHIQLIQVFMHHFLQFPECAYDMLPGVPLPGETNLMALE